MKLLPYAREMDYRTFIGLIKNISLDIGKKEKLFGLLKVIPNDIDLHI